MAAASGKQVKLFFQCKGLKDMDTFSKSDPYIVLYAIDPSSRSKYGREIGRTEIIQNNLNPSFATPISMHFLFEARQELCAVVYDDDGNKDDEKNDLCGMTKFLLSHVICSRDGKKTFPLNTKGTISIYFTEMSVSSRDTIQITFAASNLKKVSSFGLPNAYLILSLSEPNGVNKTLYKTQPAKSSLNPVFPSTPKMLLRDVLGNSDSEKTLKVSVFDSCTLCDKSMGSFNTSVAELKKAFETKESFTLLKDNSPIIKYGEIYIRELFISSFPSFTQALASGWQVNLALSIDFTGSNGDPKRPHSLHYMNPNAPNQYVAAIMSVGDILMEYDTDKQIPVFGFGASFRGVTSHFFNVNGQPNPYVTGVQGALDVYGAFLPTCILSGPTNFAPTIRSVTADARQAEAQRVYTVLLIITDGEITDMRETIDAIVEADDAPLSIVIVGVGSGCDFAAMVELDGDGVQLRASNGRVSRRDLVQFVPYRDYLNAPRDALAAEVLREIPDQFEIYANIKGLRL